MPVHVKIKKSLGDFSLDVEFDAGDEAAGLLGASGCGKSVTLSCIAGIVQPDEGEIVVNGVTFFDSVKKINLPPQKRRVGLLFQNCALFPNMTVEQNIMSVLSQSKESKVPKDRSSQLAGRLASLVEKFRLGGLERRYPAQLSGGEKQRAALARIMAGGPSILMLDEPLSALDSYLRWKLEEEISQIIEEFEGPVIYVSHNRGEVRRLCGRVCVMDSGRSEKMRTVKELFESPDTLASALLSGCENFSRIEKTGPHTVRALDWGVNLTFRGDAPDDAGYIGVRAKHIALTDKGGFPCRVTRTAEDASSAILGLEPLNTPETGLPDFSRIRAEIPGRLSGGAKSGAPVFAEIDPSNVILLKNSAGGRP